MCKYHEVAKVVEPKIAALRAAEAELKVRVCAGTLGRARCACACAACSLHMQRHNSRERRVDVVGMLLP